MPVFFIKNYDKMNGGAKCNLCSSDIYCVECEFCEKIYCEKCWYSVEIYDPFSDEYWKCFNCVSKWNDETFKCECCCNEVKNTTLEFCDYCDTKVCKQCKLIKECPSCENNLTATIEKCCICEKDKKDNWLKWCDYCDNKTCCSCWNKYSLPIKASYACLHCNMLRNQLLYAKSRNINLENILNSASEDDKVRLNLIIEEESNFFKK